MTILIICIFCTVIFLFCSWVNTFGLEKINYESEEEINKIGLFLIKKLMHLLLSLLYLDF